VIINFLIIIQRDFMKILSIIVPAYNISSHIDRCVPSYTKCKKIDEIEILFINDGSRDDTVEKLMPFVRTYPDSMYILNKENGGHGSVINLGIQKAVGKYFKVVDGDDWIESENLDQLIDDLKKIDADLAVNPYYKESQITGRRTLCGTWKVKKNTLFLFEQLPKDIFGIQLHEWTIKTKILKDNEIRLTEKCYYDDFEYITYPIPFIKTVLFFDYPIYDYLVDQASQSVSDINVFKNSHMNKKIIFDTIEYYLKHKPNDKRADKYFIDTIVNGCKQHYNIYLRNFKNANAYKMFMDFDKDLKKYIDFYDKVGKTYIYISFVRKCGKLGFFVSSILFKLYKKMR